MNMMILESVMILFLFMPILSPAKNEEITEIGLLKTYLIFQATGPIKYSDDEIDIWISQLNPRVLGRMPQRL